MKRYGTMGHRLYRLSRGQDERTVDIERRSQERVVRNHLQ